MKSTLFACALLFPLAVSAQALRATLPPVTYHVGAVAAPLFSSADTMHRPNSMLPRYSEAVVVGRVSPQLVVIRREGFLYATPANRLSNYDPDDVAPLPLDPQTQRITYQGVVEVPGVSKADLYARAAAWVAQAYTATDNRIEQQDPQAGQLVVKGLRPALTWAPYEGMLRSSYAGVVRHTLSIYVKDGRYKYVLTDLTHDALGTPNVRSGGALEQNRASLFGYAGIGSKETWDELKTDATREARHLARSLQAAMTLQPNSQAPKSPSDF